jgi:DNA-directed RNA polymerase specialized sigma24 family protein
MMDNRGANCQTEDLILFRRIFEECLKGLPDDQRAAIHQARLAKQLLDCAAASERSPDELRVVAAAGTEKTALDNTRGP